MNRIVLAHDGRSAWLEIVPELRTSFRHEGELHEFARRVAERGFVIVADAQDVVGDPVALTLRVPT